MATALEERTDFEMKSSLTGNYSISEAEGIVECFVAAIGNKDHVGDIILPGAFTESLKRRKPRVVWGHDWNHPIGKVLECYEVGPSDPRLPEKMRKAGVGGLYARVQFNLKSQQGMEAFHNIVFYGADQEWSIGYKTREGEYDGRLQANLLKVLELFEMSPVLHGANSLTATISIKSAEAMMEDDDPDDETVSRGIAMLKSYCDENPEWAKEVNEKAQVEEMKWLNDEMETKVGPGNAGAIQDAIGGDLLRGRGPRRGNLEDLLDYWRPIMKKPGGFRRCLVILADHPELGPLPNLCAWLHHETTGKWPNEGNHSKRNRGIAKRVVMGKKDMEGVISNPASGLYGDLAKALSEHFNAPITLLKASDGEAMYRRDADEDRLTYSVKYQSSSGSFFFATPEIMKLEESGGSCGCGGPCCGGEKSLEEEIEELFAIQEKAGRVLSSTNSEKIRQALALLREVLSAGGVDDFQVKEPVIRVKSGDPGLAEALMVVGGVHGDTSSYVDGSVMEIEVKSEKHRMAVQNVLNAMHANFYDQGEVE